jgi:alcohol dehydrogenase class IV
MHKGMIIMANVFLIPRTIITGKEALAKSASYLKRSGKKALIVTDKIMVTIGNVQKLSNILNEQNIEYEIFAEINSEPTDKMVYQGVKTYKETKCDFLIAIGGGSPIDTMKAIGAMLTNPGTLADYMGKEITTLPPALIAIPTTAGTGSEATQFTIISDTQTDVKMLLKGAPLLPAVAIVDPELTLTSPPNVTAATGIDALTHAIEAYTSKKSQPMSDTFAVSAVKRVFKNLLTAYKDGKDMEARKEMSIAALEAGIAFNNASVTIVHGMSRPIGALFHVPHGLSNAMLLSECLKFALGGTPERFCDLAKATGIYEKNMSDLQGGQAFITEVEKLCAQLQVSTPEQFGVDKKKFFEQLDKMAEDALKSGSPQNTIRNVGKEDIINIYKSLWK